MTDNVRLTVEMLDGIEHYVVERAERINVIIPAETMMLLIAAARKGLEAGWQPIETAPTQVGDYLVWIGEPIISHHCRDGKWWENDSRIKPTHWMPLPSPPNPTPTQREEVMPSEKSRFRPSRTSEMEAPTTGCVAQPSEDSAKPLAVCPSCGKEYERGHHDQEMCSPSPPQSALSNGSNK